MRLRVLLLLALPACAAGEDTSTSFGSNPTASASATATATATATMPTTTGLEPTTGGTGGDTAASLDPDTGSGPTSAPDTGGGPGTTDNTTGFDTNPDGAPNGTECMSGAECQTGNCYKVTLPIDGLPPGVCSECDADADCVDKGLGISCTVDAADVSGHCTDGGLGSFCESPAACKPELFCEVLLKNAEGLLPNACSECRTDADCANGERCTPYIDISMYTGNKYCAGPGSVPNNGLCPIPVGNDVCANGHCNTLNVVAMIDVGVCGACGSDADCVAPQICQPSKFDSGFFGSFCG